MADREEINPEDLIPCALIKDIKDPYETTVDSIKKSHTPIDRPTAHRISGDLQNIRDAVDRIDHDLKKIKDSMSKMQQLLNGELK